MNEPVPTFDELAAANPRELVALMSHPAWIDYFVPLMIGMTNAAVNALADPTEARRARQPDDYLRGIIRTCRAIMAYPEHTLQQQARMVAEEEEEVARERRTSELVGGPYDEIADAVSPSDPI